MQMWNYNVTIIDGFEPKTKDLLKPKNAYINVDVIGDHVLKCKP